jgi:hypothetical protein
MSVEVHAAPAFAASPPRALFALSKVNGYDVTADGQRFLVVLPTLESNSVPINLVLNWNQGLTVQ